MRLVYNVLFTIFFILSAPWYFLKMWRRGNWQRGFLQRFGRYSATVKQSVTNRHMIWLHAVSVGEVNICTQLIRALEPRAPNLKIVVSTTTSTGMAELQRKLPSRIERIYYPIDHRKIVHRALGVIHPEVVVLVEAEIWPNFLWRAFQQHIPVFLVNARMSRRSYRGYRLFGFLFRPIFRKFTGVGCQDESDAARLRKLGFRPEAIRVVGNLKFDAAAKLEEHRHFSVPALLRQVGIPENARLLVAGSTHAGEEILLAEIFLRLRPRFPDLHLVLVPRHFERGREVGRELESRGIAFMYRSEITAKTALPPGSIHCLLVNTTGELRFFYEHATLIFVGKSITAEGGQNPIEPGALGKAMVFGPNMQNFAAIAEAFVSKAGAVQVSGAEALEEALGELLSNERRRTELGQNARSVVQANLGAIDHTVNMILEHMDEDVYVPR